MPGFFVQVSDVVIVGRVAQYAWKYSVYKVHCHAARIIRRARSGRQNSRRMERLYQEKAPDPGLVERGRRECTSRRDDYSLAHVFSGD